MEKSAALVIFIIFWIALFSVGNQVTQGAEAIIKPITQFSVLQNPTAAARFSARMHPASLVKPR